MLTHVEEETIAFLRSFSFEHGRLPSLREVQAQFSLRSTHTAHYRVHRLIDLGLVKQEGPDRRYSLVATPGCCAACGYPPP